MKAIIFGVSGQDGQYLSQMLRGKSIEVIGVSRTNADISGDIANPEFVENVIKRFEPDYVFHFAANSTTRHAALRDNHAAISTGSINLLESIREFSPKSRVFLSGSAMQFENSGEPIDEQSPFSPNSAYSVARIHSIYAARYYRLTFGLKVYVGYYFNHDSPLRSEKHVNQKIVQAVKRIARGSSEKLILGNIEVRKEFNFAGDAVKATWCLVNQDDVFEAVIGSGNAYSIKDWVDYCFTSIDKDWRDFVVLQQDFVSEYETLVSNPSLIKSLGWVPEVDFYGLANLMLDHFR
jgi:GDPmannose 4,6-dehydratase